MLLHLLIKPRDEDLVEWRKNANFAASMRKALAGTINKRLNKNRTENQNNVYERLRQHNDEFRHYVG